MLLHNIAEYPPKVVVMWYNKKINYLSRKKMSEAAPKAPENKESDPKAKARKLLDALIKDGTISKEQRAKIEEFIDKNKPWAADIHLKRVKETKSLIDKVEKNGWVSKKAVKKMREKIYEEYLSYESIRSAVGAVDICYELMEAMRKNNWKDYPWRKRIKDSLRESPMAARNFLNVTVRPEYWKMKEAQRKKKDEAADKYLEENL